MKIVKHANLGLLLLGLIFIPLIANAKEMKPVGSVVFVLGQAVAQGIEGTGRKLTRKSPIYAHDLIQTNNKSQVQIRFTDNGFISVRPNSQFKVEDYSFNDEGDNKKHLSLVKGGFRAITGQIGKFDKKAFKLKTPVATLGIRGTDFTVMYCQADCGESFRGSAGESAKNGLYVGVISGGVTLKNSFGDLKIDANQYGFVQGLKSMPKAIPKPPAFLMFDRTKRENRAPLPQEDTEDKKAQQPSKDVEKQSSTPTIRPQRQEQIVSTIGSVATELREQAALTLPTIESGDSSYTLLSETIDTRYGSEANVLLPSTDGETAEAPSSGESIEELVRDIVDPEADNFSDDPTKDFADISVNQNQAFATSTGTVSGVIGAQTVNHSEAGVVDFGNNQLNGFISNTTNQNYTFSETQYLFEGQQLDLGYDSNTGLRWGRWASGSVEYEGESSLPKQNHIGRQLHWVAGGADSIIRSLPITGTATYSLVGGTNPTDNFGNTGVIGQASLTANFTATPTVNADIELTINNQSWAGSASGLPINGDAAFGGILNVNVADQQSASNPGLGQISGFFTGDQGGDAPGAAGISYEMTAAPGNALTTVSGAAALEKNP